MSNLDNLISKIESDAKSEADKIISDANKQAEALIKNKVAEAEVNKEELLAKADIEAKNRKERVLSNAELNVRNMKLAAKQVTINKAFEESLKVLSNLPLEAFEEFALKNILSLDIDGDEEITVGKNSKDKFTLNFVQKINDKLKEKGKKGELKLKISDEVKDGFILYKNGIDINCTFDALINSLRDELENEVANALFS